MNNKEARETIENLCTVDEVSIVETDIEALRMGIKALEQTEWISVKDRLLDEWEIKGKKAELWIINGKLQVRYLGTIHNVELPSPYEGE